MEYTSDSDEEQEEHLQSDTDGEEEDYFEYSAGDEESEPRQPQAHYTILSEPMILRRQAEDIENVSGVLSVSKPDAGILLRHFMWSVNKVNDEWFQDEEGVRKAVGLLKASGEAGTSQTQLTCGICFDTFARKEMKAPSCGQHFFCNCCWIGYLNNAIMDGPGSLSLRCPDPSCGSAVREDMVMSLVSDDLKSKYRRYLLRSYVEDNRKTKWCPAPGCEYAVEYVPGSTTYDIVCKCGLMFCWNCLEEAHRPVDCRTVSQWIMKNSAESENINWILAHSKPCPKCKRPIEKNQGCMHMSCTPPCKFEFCWLCLGAWNDHGERTGGFYACNRYETAKSEGAYDEAERRRDMAKHSLERYTHYYERWVTNEQSRVKALDSLQEMQKTKIEALSNKQSQPVSQLKFVLEACMQVVQCRRVLKWTYAYGYYLPETDPAKRNFFEYLQGEAENGLERLHKCAEKELQAYCSDGEEIEISFNEFRTKLAGLTSVTHNYFENLVRALENGLTDVDSDPSKAKEVVSKSGPKQNRTKKGLKEKGGASSRDRKSVV